MNNSITGTRIRDRRKELGLTADALAEMIGVSRATIFRYENGAIEKVPADLLFPLAKHLSVSVSYLLGISDDISSDLEDEQTASDYYVAYDMSILTHTERKLLTIFHHLRKSIDALAPHC